MRIRHKPYAKPELAAWPFAINDPAAQKNAWQNAFANPALPMRLEVGCGKGGFLAACALRDKEYNHLGLDIKSEVLVVAKRTIERVYSEAGQDIANVLLAIQNIEQLGQAFGEKDKIERIYINFCNPWSKAGHAKHRLTHPRQLLRYRSVLQQGGEVWFKTDDDGLFHDSLRYFPMAGYQVRWQTGDLHKDEPAWNIRTEHENMFAAQGITTKACIAVKQAAELDEEAIYRWKDV